MGKRCQVCDGPIVNGRCKYCGMPYRNDMELYHLNEDRSEHYRHASAKVKRAMAESEIPLPDRNKTDSKAAKTSAAGTRKTVSGTQTARTQTIRMQNTKVQTSRVQTSGAKKTANQSNSTQTARTYSTGKKTIQGEKKKSSKAGRIFWIIVLILLVVIGQTAEHWDTIGYRIEEFIYDEFDIDLGSIFDGSSADEVNESKETDWVDDWNETISAVKNGQDEQEDNPDWYMFTGENYIVRTDDTASEIGDTDAGEEYDYTIDPGKYRIVSGWESVAMEIRNSSGKDETVEFDEADHEEKIELHAGDEVSVVSLDGQDNYLAMYQIQQYDE